MTTEVSQEEMVREALRENVIDPEIGINVVDLGLVYGIDVEDDVAVVTMTLTTPACPLGPYIESEVESAVSGVPGLKGSRVNLVWTPPWGIEMLSEDGKLELGYW
jgi:metal-sulfur cluster biosynthetic enzyme